MGSGDGADLLQADVEELLQHDGGALPGGEALEETRSCVAQVARAIGARCRSRGGRGIRERGAGRRLAAAQLVDPDVRRRAQEVGARIADVVIERSQVPEGPQQRVLHQVLGVPRQIPPPRPA